VRICSGVVRLICLSFLLLASLTHAQQFVPHIGYVYPAGGQQGSAFQVVVGGQFLNGANKAFVSGEGVQVTVVEYNRPMTQKEFMELRDEMRALQDKRRGAARKSQSSTNGWTSADQKRILEIRNQILKNAPNRQGNPAIAENVTLQVTIAPGAEPGNREIRLKAGNGLSNPLMFCVGQLPEIAGPAAKAANPDLDRFKRQFGLEPTSASKTERHITLPVVVNGQIMPGGADRFRFTARQGQQLVAALSARQLIPYLADAVPGWFQATLLLTDARGKELVYNDDYRFHPDPVFHFEIPRDGEYVIEIKDALYRGREDFVYRLALGDLPFLTSLFPLGGPTSARTAVDLKGWNLATNRLSLEPEDHSLAILPISLRTDGRISNPLPFAVDTLPESLDTEPNNSPAEAQKVTLPIIINGRIGQPGDGDVFRFDGHAGEEVVAEVSARRLDSPLDSVLKLTDANGKQLAFNDDREDQASGLNTHHADSYLHATLPAGGAYFVHLGDTQHKGGEDYAYRLRISAPRPDFELRVVPSSINARAGVSVPLTVYAIRKDGFTDEIKLALKGAPAGFRLSGARLPAKQDQVRITLAAPGPFDAPVHLSLHGSAILHGETITRPVIPADDMLQAFAYHHLVPAKELLVTVSGRGAFNSSMKIVSDIPVKIPVDGTSRVQITGRVGAMAGRFQFELSDPPAGITLGSTSPTADGVEVVFHAEAGKAKAGLTGNLIVNILPGKNPPLAQKQTNRPNQRRAPPIGTLPAIPFEIVEQSLTRRGE